MLTDFFFFAHHPLLFLLQIFDVSTLDLAKVGRAFGFTVPPNVNLGRGGGQEKQSPSSSNSTLPSPPLP